MDKEILKKMVEIDPLEIKFLKLGEEITELRFSLMEEHKNLENIHLEIAQVLFIIRQLKAYNKDINADLHLIKMLDKYKVQDHFWWMLEQDEYWKKRIHETLNNEYLKYREKKNL